MSEAVVQVNFRMPADLKERLEKAATENRRSLTAEVVDRLENSFVPNFERPVPPERLDDRSIVIAAMQDAFAGAFDTMMKDKGLIEVLRAGAARRRDREKKKTDKD